LLDDEGDAGGRRRRGIAGREGHAAVAFPEHGARDGGAVITPAFGRHGFPAGLYRAEQAGPAVGPAVADGVVRGGQHEQPTVRVAPRAGVAGEGRWRMPSASGPAGGEGEQAGTRPAAGRMHAGNGPMADVLRQSVVVAWHPGPNAASSAEDVTEKGKRAQNEAGAPWGPGFGCVASWCRRWDSNPHALG